jgi:hypothetical protein
MFDRNAYLVQWREGNREKLRAYQRAYMKARRAKNPERAREENRKNSARRRKRVPELVRAGERSFYHSLTPEQKRERAAKKQRVITGRD